MVRSHDIFFIRLHVEMFIWKMIIIFGKKIIWKNVIINNYEILAFTFLYSILPIKKYDYVCLSVSEKKKWYILNWICLFIYILEWKLVLQFALQITMSLTYDGIWFQKHFTGLATIIIQNGKSYSSSTTLPHTNYPEWPELTALEWQVLKNLMVLVIISKEFV